MPGRNGPKERWILEKWQTAQSADDRIILSADMESNFNGLVRTKNGIYAVFDTKMAYNPPVAHNSDHGLTYGHYSVNSGIDSCGAPPPANLSLLDFPEQGIQPECRNLERLMEQVGLVPYSTAMAADAPTYAHDDERDDEDEEEEEDYVNGDHNSHGSPRDHRQSSETTEQQNIPDRFANFNLKRCRFAPRQDIELLKEIINQEDKPYNAAGKSSWEVWGKIAHCLNNKQGVEEVRYSVGFDYSVSTVQGIECLERCLVRARKFGSSHSYRYTFIYQTDFGPVTAYVQEFTSAHQKLMIFGPVLSLSALTCKLRFDFLLKNFGGHAMKYNPKRGTLEEFQKRDELLAQIIPDVPHRDDEISFGSGKRRRGRPRKLRDHFSPQNDDDDGDMMEDEHPLRHSMRTAAHLAAMHTPSGSGTKRKPGRPRKISDATGNGAAFLDGAQLAEYMNQASGRPRTRANFRGRDESAGAEPADSTPAPTMRAMPQLPLAQNPFLHQYMAAQAASQQPTGMPEGSVVTMMLEYLKRHHESDQQFKREELDSRQREKSEERRLEREQMEMKKAEMDLRRAELALQQQKWQVEREERQMNLELMKKKILKM